MHEKRGYEGWATKIESWLPTADAAKADGVSRGMEHDDVGQSVPRLLRTAMLTLLRLSVLTPRVTRIPAFRAFSRRYAESSDTLLCF
jgi:hypothetical protein